MPFTLPNLPYAPDALEPYIDKATMEIHHGKHHGAYVTNVNKALESAPELANKSMEDLLARTSRPFPRAFAWPCATTAAGTSTTRCSGRSWDRTRAASLRANSPMRSRAPSAASTRSRKSSTLRHGALRFGLGLAGERRRREAGHLLDRQPGQPHHRGKIPVMGVDVWEHAYYLSIRTAAPSIWPPGGTSSTGKK